MPGNDVIKEYNPNPTDREVSGPVRARCDQRIAPGSFSATTPLFS